MIGSIETPRIKSYWGLDTPRWQLSTPPRFCGQAQLLFETERGILLSTGHDPHLEWYNLTGTMHTEYRLGLEPGPVSDEDRELAETYFRALFLTGSPVGEEYYEAWQKADQYPKTRAFWSDVQIDEYGYLWLEDPASHFHKTERFYRVVSPEGEYLGDCALPQGWVRFSYGHYLVIDMDMEKQDFIVYRLVPAVDGFVYP
jgi:hypothetical protein